MWFLTSEEDERVIYLTPKRPNVVVGRSVEPDVNFSFPEDTSISRRHAKLSITGKNLSVTDLGSKYGTFVNLGEDEVKMNHNEPVMLSEGQQVKFGVLSSMWTIKRIHFITCASTLKGENLQNLKNLLDRIGGDFKNEWDGTCSYLTMPAITLTIKVVLALAQASHIVSLEYWNKCYEAVTKNTSLPNPNDFTPQVIESSLNKDVVSFLPNPNRRQLFAGKKFVFFSRRQMEMYKSVIEAEAATAVLLSEAKMTKSMLHTPETVVIQYPTANTSQESQQNMNQINGIVNYIKGKGKRVVADAEIGLAILYCSIEKYCNPSFSFSTELLKPNNGQQTSQQKPNVLAQETQEMTNKPVKDNVVINESLTQQNNTMDITESNTSSKRKLEDVDDVVEENNQKKIATEANHESQDFFNFIQEDKDNTSSGKTLNFSKPAKRKTDQMENDDEDIFNFVQTKTETNTSNDDKSNVKMFESDTNYAFQPKRPKIENTDVKLFTSLDRGLSVKQLLENSVSAGWKCSTEIIDVDKIKKEEDITEGLQEQISDLSLGKTIVVVNPKLIIDRKETVKIEDSVLDNGKTNFKKFKKVWPLKMQVTIIPKSAMSIVKPDASAIGDLPNSDNEDEAMTNGPSNGTLVT